MWGGMWECEEVCGEVCGCRRYVWVWGGRCGCGEVGVGVVGVSVGR